jgi:excisionase family DNA binding protein
MENENQQHEARSTHRALDNDSPKNNLASAPATGRKAKPNRMAAERSSKTNQIPSDRLLTAQEFADRLGIKRSTAYQWAYERRLPTVKLGRALRFRESEVEKLIRRNERPAIRPSLTGGD